MPTILYINGWRIFFYSNENNEPMHVHVQKAEVEAKFWIKQDSFDIEEAFAHNMSPQNRKEIRKLIFDHFDYIIEKWNEFENKKK